MTPRECNELYNELREEGESQRLKAGAASVMYIKAQSATVTLMLKATSAGGVKSGISSATFWAVVGL